MSAERMKELGAEFEKIVQEAIEIMAKTETREEAELLMKAFKIDVEDMPSKLYDMIWDGTSDAKWTD